MANAHTVDTRTFLLGHTNVQDSNRVKCLFLRKYPQSSQRHLHPHFKLFQSRKGHECHVNSRPGMINTDDPVPSPFKGLFGPGFPYESSRSLDSVFTGVSNQGSPSCTDGRSGRHQSHPWSRRHYSCRTPLVRPMGYEGKTEGGSNSVVRPHETILPPSLS